MKFVIVLFIAALVCSISAVPSDGKAETEPKPEPEPSTSPQEAQPGAPGVPETDGSETPGRGGMKPKCGIIFTRLFGNDAAGNGGYFNRRFPMGFGPSFTNERDFGRNGFDDGHGYGRRSYTPFFVLRGNRGNGRGGYNPNNDQPDSRDIEFVQS